MRRIAGRVSALLLAAALAVACSATKSVTISTGSAASGSAATDSPNTGIPNTGSRVPLAPERMPVVIDSDLDLSDIAAVAVLLRDPGLDVQALTLTPTGTGPADCASLLRLAHYLLAQLSAQVPVGCGSTDAGDDALPFPQEWRQAAADLWGLEIPPVPGDGAQAGTAAELINQSAMQSPGAVTVVALGPWTNIADAMDQDPSLPAQLGRIHAMGGAVSGPGNVQVGDVTFQDGLEWNFAADPSAFEAVFRTPVPITLVPLEATDDVPVPADLAARLDEVRGAGGGADLMYELLARAGDRITGEGQQLWDELAALTVSAPDLVTWNDATLRIAESGRLVRVSDIGNTDGRAVTVAIAADRPAVEGALVASLARGPARVDPFEFDGAVEVQWDGDSCLSTVDIAGAGIARVEFANDSSATAGLTVVEIADGHTWADLVDVVVAAPTDQDGPEWIVPVAFVEELGPGQVGATSMKLHSGSYSPVCAVGTWPDLTYVPSAELRVE